MQLRLLGALLLAGVSLLAQGCACIYLKDVGVRVEYPEAITSVLPRSQEVMIEYRANIAKRCQGLAATVVSSRERRIVLTMKPPTETHYVSAPLHVPDTEEIESFRMHGGRPIPVLDRWTWSPTDAVFETNDIVVLRPTVRTFKEANIANSSRGNYPINIVFRQEHTLTELRYRIPYREYRTWWSLPVRVPGYPLAVALDVVTSPFQLIYVMHELGSIH